MEAHNGWADGREMNKWTISSAHLKAYGAWAGNPNGWPADAEKCCVEVCHGIARHAQCTRPRGHGPEQAYCKQHDPAAQAARDKAAREKYEKEMFAKRLEWGGPTFFMALCKIADGDNNPRQTAIDAIKGYRP